MRETCVYLLHFPKTMNSDGASITRNVTTSSILAHCKATARHTQRLTRLDIHTLTRLPGAPGNPFSPFIPSAPGSPWSPVIPRSPFCP